MKLYPTVLCRRVSFLVVDSQLEQNVFALGPCWSGEDQHRPRDGYLHLVSQARPPNYFQYPTLESDVCSLASHTLRGHFQFYRINVIMMLRGGGGLGP